MDAFGNSTPAPNGIFLLFRISGAISRFLRWAGTTLCVWLILGCQIVLPAFAQGQDFDRIAPKVIPPPSNPPQFVPPPPPPVAATAQPERVVIPELKGMRLIDDVKKLQPNGVSGTGIMNDGLPMLGTPDAQAQLAAFLGKPLIFGDLQRISRTIVEWYRDHGRAFLTVTFPEQDVDSGVLQVLVTEFHVGKIKAEGNKWFDSDLLIGDMRLHTGDPIVTSQVNEDLDWLNQNPFRKVELVAEPSETPGDTDLALKTQDELPLRVYAGYDNSGTAITGRNRWNMGVNWDNAFWQDGQLSYQLTTGDNLPGATSSPSLTAHSLTFLMPLPWRDKLQIFGSYEQSVPLLGQSLGLVGINGQASMRYIFPLPALSFITTQEVQFGYDFKTANNDLQFGGSSISNSVTEVDQFSLIYHATIPDDFGNTAVNNTFVYSPGHLTGANTDAAFQPQSGQTGTDNARANYVYDTLALTRTTNLPFDTSWVMRFTGQFSDGNLLPSEQLGAGGVDSVRGYDERAANGDNGILVSEELRSPTFDLSKIAVDDGIGDQTQVLAFWDYGGVSIKLPSPGQQPYTQLESVGLGLRYGLQDHVTLRFDYGWQLLNSPGTFTHGQFGSVALTLAY
jgi:hemolysin activation/secretion protein